MRQPPSVFLFVSALKDWGNACSRTSGCINTSGPYLIGLSIALIGPVICVKIGPCLHLVNLTFMSGWMAWSYTSRGGMGQWNEHLVNEKCVVGASLYSGIPFWAHVITLLPPGWCLCVWLSQNVVYFCLPSTSFGWACVCARRCMFGSLWAESKTERRIKILKTSLCTSGCDWQEKKGLLVFW